MMGPLELERILQNSWTAKSSNQPLIWAKNNPALGQCIPTALLVQDYCGGEILPAYVTLPGAIKIPHYFNSISKIIFDFTRRQFLNDKILIYDHLSSYNLRNNLLSSEDNLKRYNYLKNIVDKKIKALRMI